MATVQPRFTEAEAAWRRLLGDDRVLSDPDRLRAYAGSTLAHAPSPAGVIWARDKQEVVEIVRVANECLVPLYTVSQGKNWGYGDASPVGPGQFVLDLSQMNRIVEVDPDLAYAVVEPGVTQGQLHAHLQDRGYPLWFPCTASSPHTSVIGNLVERGVGATPYSDHAAHACGLEVVLADGTLVETGLGRYDQARASHVHRWGVGPHLDGLFTQSNLGVVVRAAVWLLPSSKNVTAFALTMERDDQIEEAIDRLRTLRLNATLTAPVFIENSYRALANRQHFPWAATGGQTPLPRQAAEGLLQSSPMGGAAGAWNAIGSLYGTRRQVRAAVRDTRAELGGLGSLYFSSPTKLNWIERVGRPLAALGSKRAKRLTLLARVARSGMKPLQGVPTDQGLSVSRWRLRREANGRCEDPAGEGCGLYWLAPVCPAKGAEVHRCTQMIERQMLTQGFEPLIRVAFNDDRAVVVTTLLTFDRDDPDEAQRAEELYRDLTAALLEAGYPPNRAAITGMDLLDPDAATYWDTVSTLKQALDPNGILAPGRYEPRKAAELRAEPGAGSEAGVGAGQSGAGAR